VTTTRERLESREHFQTPEDVRRSDPEHIIERRLSDDAHTPPGSPLDGRSASELYDAGDLLGAARKEAGACERDGFDLTGRMLRELADALDAATTYLVEIKKLASDPFASDSVSLRACLLAAYEALGLPGPQPSPERDIARAIIREARELLYIEQRVDDEVKP
jgi:hypothetical protein